MAVHVSEVVPDMNILQRSSFDSYLTGMLVSAINKVK